LRRSVRNRLFRLCFLFLLLLLRWEGNAILPAGVLLYRHGLVEPAFFRGSKTPKSSRLGRFVARHNLVFEAAQRTQQLAGLEWFNNVAIGANPLGFFRFERL